MVVITVPGMACRHDVRAVSACITEVAGVVAFEVDLGRRLVLVHGEVTAAALCDAIRGGGYAAGCDAPAPRAPAGG